MGNAPQGKTHWMVTSQMSISLEFGLRYVIEFRDPPAELEPEPTDKPHIFYVNEEKFNAWKKQKIAKAQDDYNQTLNNDLNEVQQKLQAFVSERDPNLHIPSFFAVVPYNDVIKMTTVKWAFDPEQAFKGEDMLISLWAVRKPKEEKQIDQETEQQNEKDETEDSKQYSLIADMYPLNLNVLPDSYIENASDPVIKNWMLFVKKHHQELKPLLKHKRSRGVFSFMVQQIYPEEDTEKFENNATFD